MNQLQRIEQQKGLGAIVACALLWSTSGLLIKLIPWHPLVISGSRSFIAFLFILIVRVLQRPRFSRGNTTKKGYKLLGALSYGATMILFVVANKLTSSANVILLQYIAPVWAALLGWGIGGEKPRKEHWYALAAVGIGLLIFFSEDLFAGFFHSTTISPEEISSHIQTSILGNIIAILSGITFALYSVFMRMEKDGSPEDTILIAHLGTFLVCVPLFFLHPPAPSPVAVSSVLGLGIFQIGLASLLFAYGIRRVTAVQSMLTAVVEPVMNPVWVFLVTGEQPGLSTLTGGGVILLAVILSSIYGMRRGET
ncbi:MAG: DMT family transporter [Termitinemataceae bacterium]